MSGKLPLREFQQAVHELAAATNRAAGTGAGYGFQVLSLAGTGSNFNAAYTTTSTSDVVLPGCTTTFAVSRSSNYKIEGVVTGAVSGAAGNYGYGTIYIDGVAQTHTVGRVVALWDKANGFTTNSFLQTIFFAPGLHTVELRLHVDNAALTYQHYQALLEVFQLGA